MTGAIGLTGDDDVRRGRWHVTHLRPEQPAWIMMVIAAALLVIVTVYGLHLLARHVQLSEDARRISAAAVLHETAAGLEQLRTSAAIFASTGKPAARDELRRRLHAAVVGLDHLAGLKDRRVDPHGPVLERIERQTRSAIQAAEAHLDGTGDSGAVMALLTALRQATHDLIGVVSRLHTDAQSSNAERGRVLERDHWMLAGALVVLMTGGLVLIVMLARHNRLLAAARSETEVRVADLSAAVAVLRTANVRLEAALGNMPQALCVADEDDRIAVCNARFGALFGLTQAQIPPGIRAADLFVAMREAGRLNADTVVAITVRQQQWIAAREAGSLSQETPDGRAIAVSHQPMPGGGWIATYEDITERRQAEARLRFATSHDGLTGLPNRIALIERLAALRDAPARRGERVAVMTINLDHFRLVNDAMGHDAGDTLLRVVADRLRHSLRDNDFVARVGSDEFVVLLHSDNHPHDAEALARRILDMLSAPYEIDGERASVTASIGIALSSDRIADPDTLLTHAEASLDRAKAENRGGYRFFDPELDARMQVRRAMEQDLRDAVARGEFVVLYQPIWDLTLDRVAGFEALLRWAHPARGMVLPGDFIPLAEELGLIGSIGAWVIGQACRDAATWPAGFSVSVNLSGAQFHGDELAPTIAEALAATGLSSGRLVLEITESVLLRDDERVVATLHALRARGIRIALDDFGTGYAALSYLVNFPFDKLKIDQSFVREMTSRPDCRTIVQSIVALAAQLGIATTAEGVETEEHLALIRSAGCTEAQGFHFGRPASAQAIRHWFDGA